MRESREQSKEQLEPGEERSLTQLPKGVLLPWSKKGCMHERGSRAGQFTEGVQENRSGRPSLDWS